MDDERIFMALERLEVGQMQLGSRLERLETSQTQITSRLDRFETSQTSLRVDLMARMDRLENALTDIRNDIVVNLGAVDAIKKINDNTREEVRLLGDQVSMMFKKIQRLETRVREITGDP